MKATKEGTEKPLVNHRWHFPSIGEMLDRQLPEWAPGNHPDFSGNDGYVKLRGAFERFGDYLLSHLSLELEKAAGKGIAQALQLIRDPDYHETVKRRNKKAIERQKEDFARQDRWRERWKRCELTQEERLNEIGRLTNELIYHEKQIKKITERKSLVESGKVLMEEVDPQPEAFKARVIKNSDDDNDDWADIISFD